MECIGSYKTKKLALIELGQVQYTCVYFNDLESYPYEEIQNWVEVIMIRPSKINDKDHFNIETFWKYKMKFEKSHDKLRESTPLI